MLGQRLILGLCATGFASDFGILALLTAQNTGKARIALNCDAAPAARAGGAPFSRSTTAGVRGDGSLFVAATPHPGSTETTRSRQNRPQGAAGDYSSAVAATIRPSRTAAAIIAKLPPGGFRRGQFDRRVAARGADHPTRTLRNGRLDHYPQSPTDQLCEILLAQFPFELGQSTAALGLQRRRDLPCHRRRRSSRPSAEGENMNFGKADCARETASFVEFFSGLAGEADNDVGRQRRQVERVLSQ